jgi:hypothetical protein
MFHFLAESIQAYNQGGLFFGALICLGIGGFCLGDAFYWRVHALRASGTIIGVLAKGGVYTTVETVGLRAQFRWKLTEEAGNGKGIEGDSDIQHKLMSILYVKRRQDANNPGVGSVELERLLGCPTKHLEFHLWYLKEKGWIRRLENGLLAITVEGIDRTNSEPGGTTSKFLTDHNHTGTGT